MTWQEHVQEQIADEESAPEECIPFQVCDCPPREEAYGLPMTQEIGE